MYRRHHNRRQAIGTVVLSTFTIVTSAFLLIAMLTAATKHDCRVPPKHVTVVGGMIMEMVCPDTLAKVELSEWLARR